MASDQVQGRQFEAIFVSLEYSCKERRERHGSQGLASPSAALLPDSGASLSRVSSRRIAMWMGLLVVHHHRKKVRSIVRCVMLIALAGASLFSAAIPPAEPPLTLADAQHRAVERSRQLAAQDASITASREMAVAAGQFPDPT